MTIQGVRCYDNRWDLPAGGYCFLADEGNWYARAPIEAEDYTGGLRKHTVTEHEDSTITVSPSIVFYTKDGKSVAWHGYLERGIWREV